MEKEEILDIFKGTLQLKSMSYVGLDKKKEDRYYIEEHCGTAILDDKGKVIKRIPNIPGKARPTTFFYAGPYMLIGDTVYYNNKETKYHCNEMYYGDGVLQCNVEGKFNSNSFFLVEGKPLKRAFFRTLYTGYKLDLITVLEKNGIRRLWLGKAGKDLFFYNKIGKTHLFKNGPIAKRSKKRMNMEKAY